MKLFKNDPETGIAEVFEYDHQNRVKKHRHYVGNNPGELLAENTYNELSQLTNKKVGIKNRDIYEETTSKAFDIFPNVEQETDINGVPVPVDDSGIMKPLDASIPQERWIDNFAKAKRGKESARQKDVKHGGDGEGVKGRGAQGDKHTKLRSGRESTKNRQKPGFKKYK